MNQQTSHAETAQCIYGDHNGTFDPFDYFKPGICGTCIDPLSNNTVRSYRAAWRKYESWCRLVGASPVPATSETLVDYVRLRRGPLALRTSSRKATVTIALCALRHLHRCRDLPDPTLEAWELNIELNETPAKRDVIGRAQLESTLVSLECTPEELRSRCLLTLAFDELLSAGELAELNVEDFTPGNAEEYGALVYRSVYGGAKKQHPVTDRSSEAICAWLRAAQLKTGPLFPPMRRRGMSGNASEHTLRRALRRIGELAGITLNFRALHRGRSIELSGPDAKAERNSERSRRMYLLFECRWRDEPSAMFQMTQQRAAEREQETEFAWPE